MNHTSLLLGMPQGREWLALFAIILLVIGGIFVFVKFVQWLKRAQKHNEE